MRSHELAWISCLLECVPQVEAVAVEVRELKYGPEMRVEVTDRAAARLLADALELQEYGESEPALKGGKRLALWQGKAPAGWDGAPVCVEIVTWEAAEVAA